MAAEREDAEGESHGSFPTRSRPLTLTRHGPIQGRVEGGRPRTTYQGSFVPCTMDGGDWQYVESRLRGLSRDAGTGAMERCADEAMVAAADGAMVLVAGVALGPVAGWL